MAAPFLHYLTYQHNVQNYFREHREKYQGVIIPFSIATGFPSGTYGFVRALCAKDKGKPYALDPRAPIFQQAWDRENVRAPHQRMAQVMGPPFTTKGLASKLEPADFAEKALIASVTEACLKFQLNFRTRADDARKLAKYKKLLGLEEVKELGEPQFLIPPYFRFEDQKSPWYEISMECVHLARDYAAGVPVRPVLHFQNWSSGVDWTKTWTSLRKEKIQTFWLYPNNFKEHEADLRHLMSYHVAVQTAVKAGITPFALFGGYFAVLLYYSGLAGFANGIGYGEWRDSGYHRGGTASNRVYVLKLHRYLDAPLAQHVIEKDPEYFAYDTELLSACVDGGRPLTTLSLAECLDHFIACRKMELDFVTSNPLPEAIAEIDETLIRLGGIGRLEQEKYGLSLERWRDAIR